MFHRVTPAHRTSFGLPDCYRIRGTALTVEELEHVLDAVGDVIALAQVERALASGDPLPHGAVLTFDDGYRDHLDVVAPLLARRGASATFYVASGLTGGGDRVAIVDAWYWLLDHARRPNIALDLPDGILFEGRLDTLSAKREWVTGLPKQALLAATPTQQLQLLDQLQDQAGVAMPGDLARRLYLRVDEWSALATYGMRVGAHSVTHPRLTQVCDDTLQLEVNRSVDAIKPIVQAPPFAYPDGAFDARVIDVVRASGASSAVTCEPGRVTPATDLMALPRFFVPTPLPSLGPTQTA